MPIRNNDGVRNAPTGEEMVLEHCTGAVPFRQTGGEFLKGAMQAIGVELNLNFVDSTAVLFALWPDIDANAKCNLAHGTYDTAEYAWVETFDIFGNYYYIYHSSQIPTEANKGEGNNYIRLNIPEMDAAIDVLKDAIDPAEQVEAAYTVQEVYQETWPEIPLYYRNEARGVSAKLHNFLKNPSTSSDVWNAEDWWIDQ